MFEPECIAQEKEWKEAMQIVMASNARERVSIIESEMEEMPVIKSFLQKKRYSEIAPEGPEVTMEELLSLT